MSAETFFILMELSVKLVQIRWCLHGEKQLTNIFANNWVKAMDAIMCNAQKQKAKGAWKLI